MRIIIVTKAVAGEQGAGGLATTGDRSGAPSGLWGSPPGARSANAGGAHAALKGPWPAPVAAR